MTSAQVGWRVPDDVRRWVAVRAAVLGVRPAELVADLVRAEADRVDPGESPLDARIGRVQAMVRPGVER